MPNDHNDFSDFDFSFDDVEAFLGNGGIDPDEAAESEGDGRVRTATIHVGQFRHEVRFTDSGDVDIDAEVERLVEAIKASGYTFDGEKEPSDEVLAVFRRNMEKVADAIGSTVTKDKMPPGIEKFNRLMGELEAEHPNVTVLGFVTQTDFPTNPFELLQRLMADEGVFTSRSYVFTANRPRLSLSDLAMITVNAFPELFSLAVLQMAYFVNKDWVEDMDHEALNEMIEELERVRKTAEHPSHLRSYGLTNIVTWLAHVMAAYAQDEQFDHELDDRREDIVQGLNYFFGTDDDTQWGIGHGD